MQHLKKPVQVDNESHLLKCKALNYISAGVGCNCLVALHETGLLEALINKGQIAFNELDDFGDPLCLQSALLTLEKNEIVKKDGESFIISDFGKILCEYLGLITIFFDGYAKLIVQQGKIARKKLKNKKNLINGTSVSKASTLITDKMIDPIIIREIMETKLTGTICDLGCGYATMLSKICKQTKNHGLGFDSEPKVVKEARKRLRKTNILVELGDISKLRGIWEEVVILIQCHVFHDFTPNEKCIGIMNSYLDNFPNLKYFFYMDSVGPSLTHNKLFPGFDYVHGLLGIPVRSYEETIQMFSYSKYNIIKEVSLELPNTFLWLLSPNSLSLT